MDKSASFSPDGKHRYMLGRRWSEGPTLRWVMYCPCKADADQDSLLIDRCVHFSDQYGYGALIVKNLYSIIQPTAKLVRKHAEPTTHRNEQALERTAEMAKLCNSPIIVAWGGMAAKDQSRVAQVMQYFTNVELLCLGFTVHGAPKHPLTVPEAFQGFEPWILKGTYGRIS